MDSRGPTGGLEVPGMSGPKDLNCRSIDLHLHRNLTRFEVPDTSLPGHRVTGPWRSSERQPREPVAGQAAVFSQAAAQLRHASMQRRQMSWCPACGLHAASQSRHTWPQTRAISFSREEFCAAAVTSARHIPSIRLTDRAQAARDVSPAANCWRQWAWHSSPTSMQSLASWTSPGPFGCAEPASGAARDAPASVAAPVAMRKSRRCNGTPLS